MAVYETEASHPDTVGGEHTGTPEGPQPQATEAAQADQQAAPCPPVTRPALAPMVLLVDDEPGVLSALRRLLRPTGYRVLTAESGAAGLELLAANPVDLIISDMRMPNMNGAEFLSKARAAYPDTMRILLTGYSEIDSAVRAINEGGVYRYLNKPWDDQDLLMTIQQALEQRTLSRETARLTTLTQQQNERLQQMNAGLETEVVARTEEIRQTLMFLEDAQRDLKRNFTNMVQVCASMIELRCGAVGGQSMRVGDLARRIALAYGLTGMPVQDIFHAGLLHGIGKLSLPDNLLNRTLDRLTPEESKLYHQHPLRAQMVLTAVPQLAHVAQIIRHQYERYNGRGTPDRLVGEDISIGSRIVALARDYVDLLMGGLIRQRVSAEQAAEMIKAQSGLRYDPLVVVRFAAVLKELEDMPPVRQVRSIDLREGMRLADDLLTRRGVLLIGRDSVINAHQIEQIRRFESHEDVPFAIVIYHDA